MIALTHFVFGLSLAYVLDKRLVTASAFALVPDFDISFDFLYPFVQDGIMHSLLAAGVFTLLVLYTPKIVFQLRVASWVMPEPD